MKKLSRDERLGAILLAVIVVAAIIVAFCARSCRSGPSSESPPVTIIYKDTTLNDSGVKTKSKRKKKSSAKTSRHKKSGKKSIRKGKSPAPAPRDYLSDTIPTVQ